MSGRGGKQIQSPLVIRKAWEYMRRVGGGKVGAQYPGRSVPLPRATMPGKGWDEGIEVSRGHSSRCARRPRPERERPEGYPILEGRRRRRQDG